MPLPAGAAIRVGQLFVRGADLPQVADRVTTHLESQGAGATEGRPRRQLLLVAGRPGAPRAWHLLLDSTPTGVDPTLARALARPIEGKATLEVLRVEVEGDRLLWRRASSRDGKLADPEANLRPVPAGEQAPMPVGEDVELAAWRWLARKGVEPALRLVDLGDLEAARKQAAEKPGRKVRKRPAIGFDLVAGAAPERKALKVLLPPAREAPPTPVDAELPAGMGEPGQTIDLIKLSGTPTPERLERLATVLLAIQRRHRRAEPRPFCHLVEAPYLEPLYRILSRRKGPCREIYRTLLERAEQPPPYQKPRERDATP